MSMRLSQPDRKLDPGLTVPVPTAPPPAPLILVFPHCQPGSCPTARSFINLGGGSGGGGDSILEVGIDFGEADFEKGFEVFEECIELLLGGLCRA